MIRYDIQRGVEKIKTKTFIAISGLGLALGGGAMSLAVMGSAHAADSNVVITGNTAVAENDPGWMFNRDASTSTPYSFTTADHSIGNGSIYVAPIGSNPSDKFIAEDFAHAPTAGLNSISYDFKIAGNGTPASANQFYLNVYAVTVNDNKFYDCRFDYVPTTGSTSAFTTATFATNSVPANVQTTGTTPRVTPCPTTLGGMPAGSYIRAFSISVGDTSVSDQGLAGYLDNVKLNTTDGVTTYDFEPKMVKVQIFKYVDGVQATAVNANSATFPMTTTFNSANLGNVSNVPFTLSPTPWGGIGQPYEADFVGSVAGADYTASEVTTGNTVVGNACDSTTPYALAGYSFGSDLAQAKLAPKSLTAPQFTNLQSDYVMIVYNKTCHNVAKPVITYPANGATKTTVQMDKVDWTNVTGATAYEYRSFTDATYTTQAYDSGFTLTNSEIPTTGTPPGNYYLQVRAQDVNGNTSPWSNDAAHPYVVHVVAATTPPTTKDECRNNGWKTFNNPSYKNKAKCIDYVVSHGHKVRGDVYYTANGLKREAEFDMNTYDTNKGDFEYWDANHGHYKVKVSVVKVNGQDAWFAGVVTKASTPSWVGQWLFAKVHNGSPDKIWGTFTDQTTATAGVNATTDPTGGSFNVTKGNLKVN